MFWKDIKEQLVAQACSLKAGGRKKRYTVLHKSLLLSQAVSAVLMVPIQARNVFSCWCVGKESKGEVEGQV